jgi:magnesium transporter
MIVNSLQINDALQLKPIAPENVMDACQSNDARIWLDLQTAESNEIEAWLNTLGITGLSRRLCCENRDRSGFYPLKKEIFFVIPVLTDLEGPPEVDYLGVLCRENLLLTFHRKIIFNPQQIATVDESEEWLPERSIAGLVSAITIDISTEGLRHIAGLKRSIHDLEERMDQEPDMVKVEEILEIRSNLLMHETVVSDQLPSLQTLSVTDKSFFKRKDVQDYLNYTLSNLKAADRSLDRLRERVGALRAGFEMHAQDKTNRKLGMLTILSAIFMPITLLAGIWGMNFEAMPELKIPFAYPVAIALMALIGAGMYLFFRRGGWFD